MKRNDKRMLLAAISIIISMICMLCAGCYMMTHADSRLTAAAGILLVALVVIVTVFDYVTAIIEIRKKFNKD
jgi:uncharacterized membrane protein